MPESDRAAGAGWYADPFERHDRRFFDGTKWTDQVSDADDANSDRPGARASHIEVARTVSGDGTVTGIQARTQSSRHSPTAGIGLMALLPVGLSVAFLIAALVDEHGRWTDLGLGITLAVVSALPIRAYLKLSRHPPMLVVNEAGITCWNVYGPPQTAAAGDIASLASFTRTVGRSVMPLVTIRVNLRDGTSFWTDCVTAPQSSPDERDIVTDLVRQIRAVLHLQTDGAPGSIPPTDRAR